MTIKHWATQWALTGIRSPDRFCSCIKDRSHAHEIMKTSTTYTKTMSISMLTLKPRFLAARVQKTQLSFDHPPKTKSTYHHTKNESFSARKRSILTPRSKYKLISIPGLKRNQLRSLTRKIKSIPIQAQKSSQVQPLTLKLSQCRRPTQAPSAIRPPTQKLS